MKKKTIGVFVGSLRKGSYNKAVAKYMLSVAPENLDMKLIEIGDLPFYSEDLDTDTPPTQWTRLRNEVKAADGFLFVTPEYNRSYPAVLKNALDVASRPYGHNQFSGKPGAIASVTPGSLGAFGANHHLRQVMTFLNVPLMQQPEAYLSNISASVDENGNVTNPSLQKFLNDFVAAYADWVNLF